MKVLTYGYLDPMAGTNFMIDRSVAVVYIMLVINRVDKPPVGEEHCCNRFFLSQTVSAAKSMFNCDSEMSL